MIPLGLSSSDLQALHDVLNKTHRVRVRAQTYTLSGDPLGDLTTRVLDGQVNVDWSAAVTRSATLSLFDPNRVLSFDASSPNDGALFLDRMVRVWYGVPVNGEWIDVPVFTGPITGLSRSGDVVSVEAQGKEALAMGAAWQPMTIRAGTKKTDAIRWILHYRAGEGNFDIPDLSSRVPKTFSLARDTVPWNTARWLAGSLGRQLYYDGRGTCRLREIPGTPVYGFTSAGIVSPLSITYDASATVNAVWVKGGTPQGWKNPISYTAVPPYTDPLSPYHLGRNGVPRYLISVIEDDAIRSTAEAESVAQAALDRGLRQTQTVTFDAVPTPHLDPADTVSAATDEGSVTFHLGQFSLPLGGSSGSAMSVGYLRSVANKAR